MRIHDRWVQEANERTTPVRRVPVQAFHVVTAIVMFVALSRPLAAPAGTPDPAPSASPAFADPCAGDAHLLATLNRPTIGFSACAETRGRTLLEVGYQTQVQGAPAFTRSAQYPQPFVRYGAADRLELDLIPPNYNVVHQGGMGAVRGYGDSGIGAKFELPPSARSVFAVDTLLTFPSGSGGFSNGATAATLNLDASYSLSPVFGVATTAGFSSTAGVLASGANARYFAFLPSAVITAQLPGTVQFYVEIAHTSRIAPDGASRTILNGGVQKLLGRGVEFDVELGQTLNNARLARYHYIGVGFGFER
jgi:hypothetical protein